MSQVEYLVPSAKLPIQLTVASLCSLAIQSIGRQKSFQMSVTSQQASLMVLEKDSRALESQYGPEQVALSHSHSREHNRKVPQVLPKELAKEF